MAYAVVHGIDRSVDRRQTAGECLELVKLLQARAEPIVWILAPDGAEIRLGQLEQLHKNEVERKYIAAADRASAPAAVFGGSRERPVMKLPLTARSPSRGPITGVLLALAVMALLIGVIWRYRDEHAGARQTTQAERDVIHGRQNETAPPPPTQAPKVVGGHSLEETAKQEVPATNAGPRAGQAGLYTIVVGDTLRGIAKKAYHDPARWRDIAAANPSLDPRRLRPGEVISLPQPAKMAMPR